MNFAIVAIIIFLILLFLFFVVLIIIGLATNRSGERSETGRPSVFSSITSKLSPSKTILKTVFWIIVVLVVIIAIISLWPKSDSREEVSGSVEVDEFGADWICETVEYGNINMTTKNFNYRFYVLGLRREESVRITLTLKDKLQECEIPFTVRRTDDIAGTEVKIKIIENVVYVFVNGVNLIETRGENKIPRKYFILDGQKYNATIKVATDRSCICCQKIGPGNFKRTELITQNRIGLIKFKFQ